MTLDRDEVQRALLDPSAVFSHPAEIVARDDLTREQKIRMLRGWEYDAREMDVAEEENMGGGEGAGVLDQVLEALRALGAAPGEGRPAPTKHGA